MTTEPIATDFDPDGVAASLVGTWSIPAIDEPTGISLLHFSDTGLAIQFIFHPHQPEKRLPMSLWYSVASSTHLRIRPNLDSEGWLRGYSFKGSKLLLSANDQAWVCTRVSPDGVPEWFRSSLAAELARGKSL